MRSVWILSGTAVLLTSLVAAAAVPCPGRSSVGVAGNSSPCQFVFRADGGRDELTVSVTVLSAFDTPVANCSTSVTLRPSPETLALCGCEPLAKSVYTDLDGVLQVTFGQIGGRGSLDVCVTAECSGAIELACVPIQFTSPDLSGSCDSGVDVVDLGIWAGGLPPGYLESSDYNCSLAVDVVDLGIWAGGLGLGCAAP